MMSAATGKRLLIVDDEQTLLTMLQEWLRYKGFEVHAFLSADEALAYFEAHPAEVDMLITDQAMPGMTGKELIKKIKAINPQLPTVLFSGYPDEVSAEQTEEIGVSYFAGKPFSHESFLAEIKLLLDI